MGFGLSGCDGGGPLAPPAGAAPPVAVELSLSGADPRASPVSIRLRGTGLREATLHVDPPLAVALDFSSDTLLAFRLSFLGGAPGQHWIRVQTRAGSDRIPFEIQWPPPGTTWVETRALWISRWDHAGAGPEGLRQMVRRAAEAGFNRIYLQVRGNADAFYRSTLEPWSPLLTGTMGGDPGWDPLQVVVDEGRVRNVEIHAWINAFTGWSGGAPPPESLPRHAFLTNPDWVMATENGVPQPYISGRVRWMSPGHPGVRTRLARVAAELARSYPVAGVHLDFIRYPGRDVSFDAASLAAFETLRAETPHLTFDDARRQFVTWAVAEVRDSLQMVGGGGQRGAGEAAQLTAAVWGIYRNVRGWSGVSRGFDDLFQDPRRWAELGLVDAVAPMVYWSIQPEYGSRLDFAFLADEHVGGTAGAVEVGIDAHGMDPAALAQQVERARLAGAQGVAVFSISALDADLRRWSWLREAAFRWPARPGTVAEPLRTPDSAPNASGALPPRFPNQRFSP